MGQPAAAAFEAVLARFIEDGFRGEGKEVIDEIARRYRRNADLPYPTGPEDGTWAVAFAAAEPVSEEHWHVRRHGDHMVKWCPDQRAASRQAAAHARAQEMLPEGAGPVGPAQSHGRFLVTGFVAGTPFDGGNAAHVAAAAAHLRRIHSVPVAPREASDLRGRGLCHYEGEALRNRLHEELGHIGAAFGDPASALLRHRLSRETSAAMGEVVLGHGDFQKPNLIASGERMIALDWGDFGLCNPWYEVAHLLWFVEGELEGVALASYAGARHSGDGLEAKLACGRLIDCIIRAGCAARSVAARGGPPASSAPP